MADATLLKERRVVSLRKKVLRFEALSVAPSTTSDELVCDVGYDSGNLYGFRIATNSLNYTINVYSITGGVTPSINNILKVTDIDKEYAEMDLNVIYFNEDTPTTKNLYLKLQNLDGANATGDFQFEFIFDLWD